MLVLWLAACSHDPRPSPVDGDAGPVYALSVDVPFAELSIPDDSRMGHEPQAEIPAVGPWAFLPNDEGASWWAPMPVRPRSLVMSQPPDGLHVFVRGQELPFQEGDDGAWTWGAGALMIALPSDHAGLGPGDVTLKYAAATARERALNYQWSGAASKEAFVRGHVQVGADARSGLLLPAPGVAAFQVTVPPSAELTFTPGVVPPETMDGPPSDGVDFSVEVDADGATTTVWSKHLDPDLPPPLLPGAPEPPQVPDSAKFTPVRLDLSAYAGKQVVLRLKTDPGANATFDYAFWGDPLLAARKAHPKRVVLVFVDAERTDHLGVYGYDRATSASLDGWAKGAVVFDQAHSTAPWTLPASRAILTGASPEAWDHATTLQRRLREKGFLTGAVVGNLYLSANFGMDRDWGVHTASWLAGAKEETDKALDFLDQSDGHDSLLLLHYMDCHLPYREPEEFRHLFAADRAPRGLGEKFERSAVIRAHLKQEGRKYVQDRYDQSLAYVHDELQRVLSKLGPDDVVVYFADHGEEFWDHNGFEHGHTLYEELLHVPLVVSAPGLPAGRVTEPVSTEDITPTVLDLLGLPTDGMEGKSLVAAMKGDDAAKQALAARDLVFGRPLYGSERWGVLSGTKKYATTEGREQLFDLAADADERKNLLASQDVAAGQEWRDRMSAGLGRPVDVAWRLVATRGMGTPGKDLVVRATVPGGFAKAWVGTDATKHGAATAKVDGDVVEMRWLAGYPGPIEVFFTPNRPMAEVAAQLSIDVVHPDGSVEPHPVPTDHPPVPGADRTPLMKVPLAKDAVGVGRTLVLTWALEPEPAADATALVGTDPELHAALQAMGYEVGDGGDVGADGDDKGADDKAENGGGGAGDGHE